MKCIATNYSDAATPCGPGQACCEGQCTSAAECLYADCLRREMGTGAVFEGIEQVVGEASGMPVCIDSVSGLSATTPTCIYDKYGETGIAGLVCIPSAAGGLAYVGCVGIAKAISTTTGVLRDAHERCKYIDEDNPRIAVTGAVLNVVDATFTLKPSRKMNYFFGPAKPVFVDFYTNPAWDSELRADLFRDGRAGDPLATTLTRVCTPEMGYTEDCQSIRNSATARFLHGYTEFPSGCERRGITLLGSGEHSMVLAAACDDSDKLDEITLYEYTPDPTAPVFGPESPEARQAAEEYSAFQARRTSAGWDGHRRIVVGRPPLYVSSTTARGTIAPGNSIELVANVTDQRPGEYLYLNISFAADFVGATVTSSDGSYSQTLSLQPTSFFGLPNYFLSLTNNHAERQFTFSWAVPSTARPGDSYAAELYTKQCDPSGILCGAPISRQNLAITIPGTPASPYAIRLISPANGSSISYSTQNFSWYAVANATAYNFLVYRTTGALLYNYSVALFLACGTNPTCTFVRKITPPAGTYYWNITGRLANGTAIASETRSFNYS
ncbi:MAG: hypothetical protein AB1626_00755 [Candidatus Micrarchaeota archaeon]